MKTLLALFLLFLGSAFAQEKLTLVTQDGVLLQGKHWSNENGRPILLLHGFMESFHIWEGIDQDLHDKGYDVYLFNMRGHGNEEEKSRSQSQLLIPHPKMGFDEIVAYDVPTIIKAIKKRTGKKVTIIGHSMGGMSTRLYLSGLTKSKRKKDEMVFSEEQALKAKKEIKQIIAIASPSTFKSTHSSLKSLWVLSERQTFIMRKIIFSLVLSQRGPDDDGFLNNIVDGLTELGIKVPFLKEALESIFVFENFNDKEFSDFVHRQVSVPHKDLFDDAANWMRKGIYTSRFGRMNYENFFLPFDVPYTMIGLRRDGLAHIKDIENDFSSQDGREHIRLISNDQFSHIDIVATKEGKSYLIKLLSKLL